MNPDDTDPTPARPTPPDSLSLDLATVEAQVADAHAPARPRVSEQIGCSDLAPLLVASYQTDAPHACIEAATDVLEVLPGDIGAWLVLAAERARCWSERPVPHRLRIVASWAAERARRVRTDAGPLPEIVAVKAGLRERGPQTKLMAAGIELEPALWDRWHAGAADEGVAWAQYASHRVPRSWGQRFRACSVRAPIGPLVTYPDGWGEDDWASPFVVNCKTTLNAKDRPDPPAWIQVQGEMACTGSARAVLPHGIGWLADDDHARRVGWDPEPTRRRVVAFWVDRHEAACHALMTFAQVAMTWIHETATKGNGT